MPALFTRPSMLPNRDSTSAATRSLSAGLRTSACRAKRRSGSVATNSSAACAELLYVNATLYPSASRRMAVTRPMPRDPPVMRMVLLSFMLRVPRHLTTSTHIELHDLLVQFRSNGALRLIRAARPVGGENQPRVVGEGAGRGLGVENVESQTGQVIRGERVEGGALIEHLAPGGVDQEGTRPHGRDLARADHPSRFRRQRYVQG